MPSSYLLKTGTTFLFTSTPGDYTVRFYDYDGKLLKSQGVTAGRDATAPALPAHEGLTFDAWNQTFANVQRNIDVGAIYETSDGKTHAGLRITTVTGLTTTLYINKSDGSTLSVDYGDGIIDTFTNIGNFNTGEHIYPTIGDYTVKIWISSGGGTYGFGNASPETSFCGGSIDTMRAQLVSIYIGSDVEILGQRAFSYCYALAAIMIPYNIISIGHSPFAYCYALAFLVMSNNIISIGPYAFFRCYALAFLVMSNNIISIGFSPFGFCYALAIYQFLPTTPPTIGANAFTGISASSKIYVPDASVAAYKAATNWITWADYICPISEMP